MVLVPTLISQQDNWPAILRDQQVGRTVAVVITGDDGPRFFESDLVEADVGGDIFESVWAEIAKQPHFALAIGGFANRNQVNPAVIVVIDGSDAPAANPVGRGQCNLFEGLPVIVTPESYARCSVSEG